MTSRPGDEEGGDTLGELPSSSLSRSLPITARPSLHGLEREFSTRLGATSDNHGGKANDAKVPTFTDYLRAQRAIYHSNRKNFSRSAVDPNANEEATAGNHATAPTTPQTSMAVASAVAKLRKRSQPPNVNASSSTSGAYAAANFARMASSDGDVVISSGEQRALQALGALERRGSVSNFNGGGDLDDQATLLHDLETLDEDGHGHDHDGILPWYSPPIQRQRWDKDQIVSFVVSSCCYFSFSLEVWRGFKQRILRPLLSPGNSRR
mmetsp:Transcript_6723/g.14661  ORF Transcript_6723/g.14661 Transcript_6723/m.14661 type:complete len:266 (+) Transcript_6723:119-916(+)